MEVEAQSLLWVVIPVAGNYSECRTRVYLWCSRLVTHRIRYRSTIGQNQVGRSLSRNELPIYDRCPGSRFPTFPKRFYVVAFPSCIGSLDQFHPNQEKLCKCRWFQSFRATILTLRLPTATRTHPWSNRTGRRSQTAACVRT
jgi:hypothetical protein